MKEKLKIGTVCSGIGAPEKALQLLGIDYELAYFCEFDKYASTSYCAMHNENPGKNLGDLTKVDFDKLPKDLDLLVGGTPCQDFSLAGKRAGGQQGSGTRSSLMWNFVEMIDKTKPKAVLWENVPGCLSGKMKATYQDFCQALRNSGYVVHEMRHNAKFFGVPQNRDRVFVLAIRKDQDTNFVSPIGYDCGIRLKDVLQKEVEPKFYLSDKTVESFNLHKARHDAQGHGFGWKPTDGNGFANTLQTNAGVRPSDNFLIELTKNRFVGVWDGYNQRMRKESDIVGTLTQNCGADAKRNGQHIVQQDFTEPTSYRIRKLTPKECFRLMGFVDEDFYKCQDAGISNSQLYKQAGNSIVVNVLMAIFGQLYGVEWQDAVYGKWKKTERERNADLPLFALLK